MGTMVLFVGWREFWSALSSVCIFSSSLTNPNCSVWDRPLSKRYPKIQASAFLFYILYFMRLCICECLQKHGCTSLRLMNIQIFHCLDNSIIQSIDSNLYEWFISMNISYNHNTSALFKKKVNGRTRSALTWSSTRLDRTPIRIASRHEKKKSSDSNWHTYQTCLCFLSLDFLLKVADLVDFISVWITFQWTLVNHLRNPALTVVPPRWDRESAPALRSFLCPHKRPQNSLDSCPSSEAHGPLLVSCSILPSLGMWWRLTRSLESRYVCSHLWD